MPNAVSRWATRTPMRPSPTMPRVFSNSSMPVKRARCHSPLRSDAWAALIWRAAARSSPMASSAALTMLEVGAFTTMTPARVAARTSTLSRPTPARATTLRFFATASASASTLVADLTRIASASTIADSSSARSAPLQRRISKSGPSASTVAGLSSSAISTTGLLTAACPRGPWERGARRCARSTLPDREQRPETVRIEGQRVLIALERGSDRTPLDPHRDPHVVVPTALRGHDVALGQPAAVHEDDLVSQLTVVGEDVLDDAEQFRLDQRRLQLLRDLAHDCLDRPLAQLDATAEQPVEDPVTVGVVPAQDRVMRPGSVGQVGHCLDPDVRAVDHAPILAPGTSRLPTTTPTPSRRM